MKGYTSIPVKLKISHVLVSLMIIGGCAGFESQSKPAPVPEIGQKISTGNPQTEADARAQHFQTLDGEAKILQSWQGDFPVAQLRLLPEGQREKPVGFINDAKTFEGVWKAFSPGEAVPGIDFKGNLILFARNTQFYNRIRIGKVNVTKGVAEVLAMETMSAMPIEDKVAMSLVLVAKQGISGIQAGDKVTPVNDKQ